MAIKKIIEIDVEQVKAMGGLDALQQSLKETETQGESLRTELRKLKQQLAELPEGSAEYNKIAKRAGEVSDKISDISTRIKNLGSDTKNIDAVVQGAQTLSGAFTVASSATALLGEENKDLQEQMLKVEAAIGLTVGIQSIANALQKESALYIGLSNIATKIQIGLQVAYAAVVGTTTGALKALRVALISTGVGALVVALGLLIAKMTESTESTEDLEKAQASLNDEIERSQDLYNEYAKNIDFITKVRTLQAKIAGKNEADLQKLEKEGIEKKRALLLQENVDLEKQLNNEKASSEQRKKLIADIYANKKEYIDLGQQLTLSDLEFENSVAEKRRDAEAKANEKAIAEAKRIAKEKVEIAKKLAEDLLAFQVSVSNSELEQNIDIKKQADEILKSLEPAETPAQKLKREFEEKKAILEAANVSTLELQSQYITASEALEEEARLKREAADEKELQRKKILKEQELALTAQTFGKIADLAGRNSKIGKAFAVGQALINTYQGITAELQTKAVTPYEIGLKVANVAFVAATGFKAVKQILATNPMSSGGGAGGGSASSGGAPSATPQFNIVGQSSTNQLTSTIAGQQNRPVQTYVVGSQVSSQQALDRNAVATSTFG